MSDMHNPVKLKKLSNNEVLPKFLIPTNIDLKKLRHQKGFTQALLAEFSNVSQSLIARIENGTVNPRISTVRTILLVLQEGVQNSDKIIAGEIVENDLITINQEESVRNAIGMMNKHGISQLPVIDINGKLIGSITEKKIMFHLTHTGRIGLEDRVSIINNEKLPEISKLTPLKEIERLLMKNPAIIVNKEENKRSIITKSDLLNYIKELK